jgi:hypothetical protein
MPDGRDLSAELEAAHWMIVDRSLLYARWERFPAQKIAHDIRVAGSPAGLAHHNTSVLEFLNNLWGLGTEEE